MEQERILGLPVMNAQALLGIALFLASVLLVKLIRGIQTGRYPAGAAMLVYLRTLLGFVLTASLFYFFGALLGFRYL